LELQGGAGEAAGRFHEARHHEGHANEEEDGPQERADLWLESRAGLLEPPATVARAAPGIDRRVPDIARPD
jgi:hypothetical protein